MYASFRSLKKGSAASRKKKMEWLHNVKMSPSGDGCIFVPVLQY